MRVPVEWLREHCSPEVDTAALADRLNLSGTEVKGVEHHGVGGPAHFVVGRVLEAVQHPDADRLRVCSVDVGTGSPAEIVCGAPNVAAGQTVAVARPGAVMPDGTKLKKAKLRGVVSHGMILAEDELAIGTDHDGILVLATDGDGPAPGTPLDEVLPVETDVLECEITPNRPDCLAIYGVAREAHAATGAPLGRPPWADDPGSTGPVEGVTVEVRTERCPRFTARVFEDVRVGPSPPWLKARLTAAGMRPISNVVDVTNYAMLLTGQPLHAFDLDRVAGQRLVVREAREGETIDTLDGATRELHAGELVIDDADGPTSLAAVMGGARSEVADDTTRVLLEVAAWDAPTVQRTSVRMALRSEASARFEKGLSVEQTMEAQAVATRLLVELCGARVVPGTIDVGVAAPGGPAAHAPRTLRLRERTVTRLLGVAVARARQAEILRALEFAVTEAEDGLDVVVPHFRRADVTREADLVEEVARIDGVERLPATLPARRGASGRLTPLQRARRRAEDVLVGRGLHEVVGWSFTDPGLGDRLRLPADDPRRVAVALENPMSEDQSVLRTTLLGSLLDAARHNRARGAADLALWERGSVYLDGAGPSARARAEEPDRVVALPLERIVLGAVLTGASAPASWRDGAAPAWDAFGAAAVAGAVLDALRVPWDVRAGGEHPFLHPGRSGRLFSGETELGWVGEVHPLVLRAWELEDAVVAAFELDLDLAIERADLVPAYRDVTSFPAVRQDLAVVVGADVPAADVLAVVRARAGPLLEDVRVFDVFRGAQLGEGRLSLAVHLTFRAPDRTLTDDEVRERVEAVVAALRGELGAEPRG
jgi:phenylalanyl-tRNA synthetase beta chain